MSQRRILKKMEKFFKTTSEWKELSLFKKLSTMPILENTKREKPSWEKLQLRLPQTKRLINRSLCHCWANLCKVSKHAKQRFTTMEERKQWCPKDTPWWSKSLHLRLCIKTKCKPEWSKKEKLRKCECDLYFAYVFVFLMYV